MRLPARGTPGANGRAVKNDHLRVRGATETDTCGQFKRLKCVEPLEMPLVCNNFLPCLWSHSIWYTDGNVKMPTLVKFQETKSSVIPRQVEFWGLDSHQHRRLDIGVYQIWNFSVYYITAGSNKFPWRTRRNQREIQAWTLFPPLTVE
jgi:hypothetical protein